jgi:glycosyltransferase involved in cell wall biosynthesis
MAATARRWMKRDRRYRWTGDLPHAQALRWIARSHVLVVSSVMEGGANVICEAARIGTPVIASRVPGNVGMLGRYYPGYYKLFDEKALGRTIAECRERKFLARLRATKERFAPAAERLGLLKSLRSIQE